MSEDERWDPRAMQKTQGTPSWVMCSSSGHRIAAHVPDKVEHDHGAVGDDDEVLFAFNCGGPGEAIPEVEHTATTPACRPTREDITDCRLVGKGQ